MDKIKGKWAYSFITKRARNEAKIISLQNVKIKFSDSFNIKNIWEMQKIQESSSLKKSQVKKNYINKYIQYI